MQNNLEKLRTNLGLSLKEISNRTGFDIGYIRRREEGAKLTVEDIGKLSKALDCHPCEILDKKQQLLFSAMFDNNLTADEMILIKGFRKLNKTNQKNIKKIIDVIK